MEKDLHRVKDVMDNLSKEGARLSQALNTLKLPPGKEYKIVPI